jgi:hypothetical protein
MLSTDAEVIRRIVQEDRAAARIFVTGEAAEGYIGEAAVGLLISVNDVYYREKTGLEPLFIQTRAGTVRMVRFDPDTVWREFHPDILVGLVGEEAARLGVDMDPYALEHFDFYESMIAALRKKIGEGVIPEVQEPGKLDDFYNAVYLANLLLFNKSGYLDIPAAEHFSLPSTAEFMKTVKFHGLTASERVKVATLQRQYKDIQALTNPELNYVVGLYERQEGAYV